MAGMFSNNNDFSWNSDTIFDKIGTQNVSPAPEMTVTGPDKPSYGMMDPDEKLEFKAEVLF